MWTIFKVFVQSVTVLLLCYVLFSWSQGCGILASQPGIELASPSLEGEVLTIGNPNILYCYEFSFTHILGSTQWPQLCPGNRERCVSFRKWMKWMFVLVYSEEWLRSILRTHIPLLFYIWITVPHLLATTFTPKIFTLKIFLRFLDSKVCS